MKARRTILKALACAAAALGIIVVPALADELIGEVLSVNVDANKIVVRPDLDPSKKVEVTVSDETVLEVGASKEPQKVNMQKLKEDVEEQQQTGDLNIPVEVTHKNRVASKIRFPKHKSLGEGGPWWKWQPPPGP